MGVGKLQEEEVLAVGAWFGVASVSWVASEDEVAYSCPDGVWFVGLLQ